MSSRCLDAFCAALLTQALCAAPWALAAEPQPRQLRVCADPDNLPYSSSDGSGFENRIAAIVAAEMHAQLSYAWLPQRRGYVRKTMGAGLCDVFIGVPVDMERVLTTRPYYRSSYVFVWRRGEDEPTSFDDARIAERRIGVQLVGNDLAATPPGYALARAGARGNIIGYPVYGDGPAAQRMIAALAAREIESALVWGPQAGWFARRSPVPMQLVPATAPADLKAPFDYAIAMGVARGNHALRDELDAILRKRRADIDAVLAAYAVPRTDLEKEPAR